VAPAARWLSAADAYRFAQALSAAFWAATLVPAYLLARRLVPPGASLAVAALSVAVPASVYATAVVPDALAVLLGVSSLALLARASTPGSGRDLLGALALATGAALARPWFAVLPPALLVAYGLPRDRWRSLLRWPRPLVFAGLAGVAFFVLARAAPEAAIALASLGSSARAAAASFAVAIVGVGIIPWLLAASGVRPVAARPETALLATCLPALALTAGALGTLAPGRGIDERPLLLLAPLVLALAARALLDGGVRLGQALGAEALLLAAALALPALGRAPAARAAGLSVVSPDGGSHAYLVAVVSAAVVVGVLLLVVLRRRTALLAAALAILLLVGQAAAWSSARAEARVLAAFEPGPHGWIDRSAGAGARVVVAGPPEALDRTALAQLTLWNRSIRGVQELSFLEIDPHSGQLGVAPRADLVLVRGTELAGTEVARSAGGVLVRPPNPLLNLAETVEGVFPDGWSGEQAVYRRFSGSPGTVLVTIGRPDGPPAEAWVEAWRGEEVSLEAQAHVALASGAEKQLVIEVPPPQFRVVVRIEPTFPAEDGRQLGARVRFEYRPRQ